MLKRCIVFVLGANIVLVGAVICIFAVNDKR